MSNKKNRQKMIKKRQQKSKKAELDEIGRLMSQIESIPAARPRPTTPAGMGDVIAVDKEMRYGKQVSPAERAAVQRAKKMATPEQIKKGFEDTAHYDPTRKKTGGPLKYSVGGPIKPAWMRNR